jgi:hypothetical protein
LEEVFEDREAWVVRSGPEPPPKGDGPPSFGPDGSEGWKYNNVPIHTLLKNVEIAHKVLTADETGLTGGYDISVPEGLDFDELREHLATKYGLTMSLEHRKVQLWRLRSTAPTSSAPSSAPVRAVTGQAQNVDRPPGVRFEDGVPDKGSGD